MWAGFDRILLCRMSMEMQCEERILSLSDTNLPCQWWHASSLRHVLVGQTERDAPIRYVGFKKRPILN